MITNMVLMQKDIMFFTQVQAKPTHRLCSIGFEGMSYVSESSLFEVAMGCTWVDSRQSIFFSLDRKSVNGKAVLWSLMIL